MAYTAQSIRKERPILSGYLTVISVVGVFAGILSAGGKSLVLTPYWSAVYFYPVVATIILLWVVMIFRLGVLPLAWQRNLGADGFRPRGVYAYFFLGAAFQYLSFIFVPAYVSGFFYLSLVSQDYIIDESIKKNLTCIKYRELPFMFNTTCRVEDIFPDGVPSGEKVTLTGQGTALAIFNPEISRESNP